MKQLDFFNCSVMQGVTKNKRRESKKNSRCKICGNWLLEKGNSVFCTNACKKEDLRRRSRARHGSARKAIACQSCGIKFSPLRARKFCSDICRVTGEEEIARKKKTWLIRKKRCESGENVVYGKVFTRDQWRCQYCGKEVTKAKKHKSHCLDAHLDHVLPLSRGGKHLYSNVVTSCRDCNLKKGADIWRPLDLAAQLQS